MITKQHNSQSSDNESKYNIGVQDVMKAKGAFNELNRTRPKGEKILEWRSYLAGYIVATNTEVLPDEK